jgi:IS5 family transposase|tara:strand:+ start:162 stop:293 length:132 start_codon:yes stop_codon:yes gene_type:complete
MQKPFATQPELFVTTRELDHRALHALDDTEAVLDWSKIEPILR